ncbi:hypothetical protein ACFWPX_30035 [Nocardia sp. NPDC058518]|uniref:hypothetical protein n=1 Tax=Nocardia sp. NPDC058518 TaxID=3346534 RepID=UPI003668D002
MFTIHQTIDGQPRACTYTERDTIRLLRTGHRRGVEIDPRAAGGAVLRWTPPSLMFHRTPREIRIEAQIPVRMSTALQANLDRIHDGARADLLDLSDSAKARLYAAGLIIIDSTQTIRVTLAARLALTACAHRTHTRAPRGYHHPADHRYAIDSVGLNKPGGRAGKIHDRTSHASCTCGALDYFADDRSTAARAARRHRAQAAAALVEAL